MHDELMGLAACALATVAAALGLLWALRPLTLENFTESAGMFGLAVVLYFVQEIRCAR